MNKNHRAWSAPVSGVLLLATAVSAEQNLQTYLDSTNRVTLSLRFGLNIKGKFTGVGRSFGSGLPLAPARRTPDGDLYNYDNGYVLPDAALVNGSNDGITYYWGYDYQNQVNPGSSTVSFNRTTTTDIGLPSEISGDDSARIGAELAYNYEIGIKEDWHHLRYGLELALNYMPINFASGGLYNAMVSRQTDVYGYESLTTPPGYVDPSGLPFQGRYNGINFLLNSTPNSSTTTLLGGARFLAQQRFDGNLWGIRLGPYIEYPFNEKWSLHLSGGLAVGLLDSEASWKETISYDGGSVGVNGGSKDFDVLWGYYIGLDVAYQINKRWGIEVGVQFQDLGVYRHDFGGRGVELDLSQSLFIHAGISYSF